MTSRSATRLDELLALYERERAAMTEEQKARLEQTLWELAKPTLPPKSVRRRWLAARLGISGFEAEERAWLLEQSHLGDVLWPHLEGPGALSRTYAVRIARDVIHRGTARKALDRRDRAGEVAALKQALLHPAGRLHRCPDGRIFYQRSPFSIPPRGKVRAPRGASLTPSLPSEQVTKRFFQSLRTQILGYVEARLTRKHGEPSDEVRVNLDQYVRDFDIALRALFDELLTRLHKLETKKLTPARSISRRKLNAAFRELSLAPPDRPDAIDLRTVRQRKKRLARLYHPDSSGTNSTEEKYRAVIAAGDLIERFVEETNPVRKP